MVKNETVQLKSYNENTGTEIGNVYPITNSEAVKIEDNKNLKEELLEINEKIKQTNSSLDNIESKLDEHIENCSDGSNGDLYEFDTTEELKKK